MPGWPDIAHLQTAFRLSKVQLGRLLGASDDDLDDWQDGEPLPHEHARHVSGVLEALGAMREVTEAAALAAAARIPVRGLDGLTVLEALEEDPIRVRVFFDQVAAAARTGRAQPGS